MADDGALKSDSILIEQQRRWHAGDHVRVEALLSDVDIQALGPEAVLDVIYSEVLLREDLLQEDLTVDAMEQEYLDRFPEFSKLVSRQFQVHRALQSSDPYNAKGDTGPDTAVTLPARRRESGQTTKDSQIAPQTVQIPGFQLLEVAGKGGSGVAYRALDERLNRIVAVKLLIGPDARDEHSSRQLLREAEAAASLVHPMIVQIYQVGEAGGSPFLVMEFIDGGTLANRLQEGPLPVAEALETAHKIAQAVQYAHDQGIIHRDLKPGNVLLDSAGEPHVCDFGLARRLDAEHTLHATGDVLGTPAYMPPEQARGEAANERSDVYSVGAILYELLCGRSPFQAATPWEILHQVMTDDPAPLRQLNSALPKDLETICERCLEKDPARRYASAQELADELRRFTAGQPINARPVGRVQRLFKWCRRNPSMAALAGVVAVTLLGAAIVSTLSQRRVAEALGDTKQALAKAEGQRDLALSAMNDLVHRVYDDLTKREATLEARGQVLDAAIDGLQEIIDEGGDSESTRLTKTKAHTRRAYIYSQLAQHEESEAQHRLAIETGKTLTSQDGKYQLAQVMANFAQFFLRVAKFDDAKEIAEQTIAYTETLLDADPDSLDLQNVVMQCRSRLATVKAQKEGSAAAIDMRREVHETCVALHEAWPEATKQNITQDLLNIKLDLIAACLQVGLFTEAETYLLESLELLEDRNPEETEDVQVRRLYYTVLGDLATTQFAHMEYNDTYKTLKKAVDGYAHVVEAEVGRPGPQLRAGGLHQKMAACLKAMGRLEEAKLHTQKQIDHYREGLKIGGEAYNPQRYAIAVGLMSMAELHAREGDYRSAMKAWQDAADIVEPIVEQYQAQAEWNGMKHMVQLFAGVLKEDSEAAPEDVAAFDLALQAWAAADKGDLSIFETNEQKLIDGPANAASPVTKLQLQFLLATTYGLQHRAIVNGSPNDKDDAAAAAKKCIEAINAAKALGTDPMLPVAAPEFDTLRQTDEFRAAFPVM